MTGHAVRMPRAADNHAAGEVPPRRTSFERLARVQLRHGYYDASGGACPVLAASPTGASAELMRRLGLLFRAEPAGFSVLFDRLRERQLLDFLEREQRRDGEAWTRLCFVLTPTVPWFVNVTALPVDASPARRNVYLTNRQAHVVDGEVLLPPRSRVTAADLVPVDGGQLVEETPEGVKLVRVLDVSGLEVICRPRCVTAEAARRTTPDRFDCADIAPEGTGACSDRVYLDLTAAPEEKYLIQTVWYDGAVVERQTLYTVAYPVPIGFVELLFSDPTGGNAPTYPVRGLGGEHPRIATVDYVVPFAARATWWSYYVTVPPPDEGAGEPRIRQVGGARPRVRFHGPCCVTLPGGRRGWRFVSTRPVTLAQRSPLQLQLLWRRGGDAPPRVLVDRLPVPDGHQVLPVPAVRACAQAWASLCERPPPQRCRRLLDALCPDGPGIGPERRNFSDVFVNV